MAEGNDKLEFFSDIRDKFLLIIGGIISLTTVIPAFLNKTSEIFGWESMALGYSVFVAIYFVLPYVFYQFYCSIYDEVGYEVLLPMRWMSVLRRSLLCRIVVAIVVPAVALIYLILSFGVFSFIFFCLLVLFSLFCFGWAMWRYHSYAKKISKEMLAVGAMVIVVFGLFFSHMIVDGIREGEFSYKQCDQKVAFDAYDTLNQIDDKLIPLLDSAKQVSDKYQARAELLHPHQFVRLNNQPAYYNTCFDDIYEEIVCLDSLNITTSYDVSSFVQNVRPMLANLLGQQNKLTRSKDTLDFAKVHTMNVFFHSLTDYGGHIQKAKVKVIAKKWLELLKVLQYRSLGWFFLLIILGLCMWLKMQVRMQGLNGEINTLNELKMLEKHKDVKRQEISKKQSIVSDNLSQIKSFIFLIFVLIVPWFRSINEKDIELDKPFLNISLNNLIDGRVTPDINVSAVVDGSGSRDTIIIQLNQFVDTNRRDSGRTIINTTRRDTTISIDIAPIMTAIGRVDSNLSKARDSVKKHVSKEVNRVVGSIEDLNN